MAETNVTTMDELASETGGTHEPPMCEDFPRQADACKLLDTVTGYDDLVVLLASLRESDPQLYEAVLLRIDQVEGTAAVAYVEQEVSGFTDAASASAQPAEAADGAQESGAQSEKEAPAHRVELDLSAVAEGREDMGPKYFSSPVKKPGRVAKASPYLALRKEPIPGEEYLSEPGNELEQLHFNDQVFVLQALAGDWYLISSNKTGRQGYVWNKTIRVDPPEPAAGLYAVEQDDTLIGIAEKHYGSEVKKGQDLRFYVFAMLYANDGALGLYKLSPEEVGWTAEESVAYALSPKQMEWKLWGCKQGHSLWVPSVEFANALKGKIPDGTLTDGNWARLKEGWDELKKAALELAEWAVVGGAFVAGVVHGAVESLWDLAASIPELGELLFDVFGSLIQGDLIADAEAWWDDVSSISAEDLALYLDSELRAKWNDSNPLVRGHFIGWLTGYAVMEVVMMAISGGAVTAIKWTGKAGKLAKFLTLLGRGQQLMDRVDGLADTNKLVSKARKLVDGKKKDVDLPDAKKPDVDAPDKRPEHDADKPRDKDNEDGAKKKDDEDESKPQGLANKAARQGFEAAERAATSAIRSGKEVLNDATGAVTALSARTDVKVDLEVDENLTARSWGIRAVVKKDGERAQATRGLGWLATGKSATHREKDATKWYVEKDQRAKHERLVQELDARLEADVAKLIQSGKGTDLNTLGKALEPAVRKAESVASGQMVEGIAIDLDEALVREGKDERGKPALIYPYIITPNADEGEVPVSKEKDDEVEMNPTLDVKHPWLAAVPVNDMLPYKFIPRGRTFGLAFKDYDAELEKNDRDKLWEAAREDITYLPERLKWRGDRKSNKKTAGEFETSALPDDNLKAKRVRGARERLAPGRGRWIEAMLAHDHGRSAQLFTSLTAHEGVESEGHTIDRHVLGRGRFNSHRDIARRAAFDFGVPSADKKASAFEKLSAADSAAKIIAADVAANWRTLRNELLQMRDGIGASGHELAASTPPTSALGYGIAPATTPSDEPEYLGLGTGVKPLFASDTASAEWEAWYSSNASRALPHVPVALDLSITRSLGYLRPTSEKKLGGWYFKTLFPSE